MNKVANSSWRSQDPSGRLMLRLPWADLSGVIRVHVSAQTILALLEGPRNAATNRDR